MAEQNSTYLTPNQVAKLLLVSPITVRQWAQKGILPATTTAGGHRRFARSDVEVFARERGIALGGNPSVLVVDDDIQLNKFLVALFQTSVDDIDVYSAADGFEAGRLVQQHKPQVVVLDIMMPGIDGVEVCRSIKAQPDTAHIHVVAMTGHFSDALHDKIRNAGAAVLLKKPFDSEVLLEHCGFSRT